MDNKKVKQINRNVRNTAKDCVDLVTNKLSGTNFDEQYLWSYIEEAINNSVSDEPVEIPEAKYTFDEE